MVSRKSAASKATRVAVLLQDRGLQGWGLPILIAIITFALRALYLGRSFDIFIDEVTYLQVASNFASRMHIELGGRPFFLHPPAWMIIEGAFIKLFGVSGSIISQIYATRLLVVLFAAISGALIFLLARHFAGWPAGLLAALLFALDPFVIKLNSLNMIETSAMTWVLAGFWTLVSGMADAQGIPQHEIPRWRQIVAGLFFGLALLTKEMTFFLTLLPLVVCYFFRGSLSRRAAALTTGVAALVYAVYPVTVALLGLWQPFIAQKTKGLARFVGLVQTTGFNRPGGPSLVQTVVDRLNLYAATYLLLALGPVAIYVLWKQRTTLHRTLAIWSASAYVLLGYSIAFGTLEEQFFYYLVIFCILACAVAIALFFAAAAAQPARRPVLTTALALLVLVGVFDASQWAVMHLQPDNGYQSVLTYLQRHVPRGARVASTSETGQFVLEGYRSGPWGSWTSVGELEQYAPHYVLVVPQTLQWNNSDTAQALMDWVQSHGQEVYAFRGREGNDLLLYDLRTGSLSASGGERQNEKGSPPAAGGQKSSGGQTTSGGGPAAHLPIAAGHPYALAAANGSDPFLTAILTHENNDLIAAGGRFVSPEQITALGQFTPGGQEAAAVRQPAAAVLFMPFVGAQNVTTGSAPAAGPTPANGQPAAAATSSYSTGPTAQATAGGQQAPVEPATNGGQKPGSNPPAAPAPATPAPTAANGRNTSKTTGQRTPGGQSAPGNSTLSGGQVAAGAQVPQRGPEANGKQKGPAAHTRTPATGQARAVAGA